MNARTCKSGLFNSKILNKIKSSLLSSSEEPQMNLDEYNKLISFSLKGFNYALKTENNGSKFGSIFYQRYKGKRKEMAKTSKNGRITMNHTYSTHMLKTSVSIPFNLKNAVYKLKESNANNIQENMNMNLNNDLYLSNYNINTYISRTDTSRQLIREEIKLRKEHCSKPSLSIAFISKRNKRNHSNTFNDQEINHKYNNTFSRNIKFHDKAISHFRWNQPIKKKKKCFIAIREASHRLIDKQTNFNIQQVNEIDDDLFKVMKIIHRNKRNEMNINNKDIFKKLKGDIKKSDYKIKTILDDLRRTQTLNDAGLKRKGFIMKIGCITGEYFK